MNSDTRSRLLGAAADLFAKHGYRGASVRGICDLARANPGAVSYHFGGKKQLYRTVLRRAAASLSQIAWVEADDIEEDGPPRTITEIIDGLLLQLDAKPHEAQLLFRDLAEGGGVAVEALEPTLRAAFEGLLLAIGEDAAPRGSSTGQALFLDLASPLFLLTAAWPVLQRALDLDPDHRRTVLAAACRRTLEIHGHPELV